MILNTSGTIPVGLTGQTFFITIYDTQNTNKINNGIYCVDRNFNKVKINSQALVLGTVDEPGRLAQDTSGNIYFIESVSKSIYKTNISSGETTVFAWADTGGVYNTSQWPEFSPVDILVDQSGNVYVSDTANHRIIVFPSDPLNASYLLAGGEEGYLNGQGAAAKFSSPLGMALDGSGNLYVADSGNNVIRRINIATKGVSTYAGGVGDGEINGQLLTATFISPGLISYDGNGSFYVTSTQSDIPCNLRKISGDQVTSIVPGGSAGEKSFGASLTLSDVSGTLYSFVPYETSELQIYKIEQAGAGYELLSGEGATGATGATGPQGPISPVSLVAANNSTSSQSFSLSDKGNTYIITSNSNTTHTISSANLTALDAGFYVYLRNGNPKTGYDIIIYHNNLPVNDSDENSILFAYTISGNASNCILYWSGTGFTLY
jgi:sugar lactone lactonase YvrE